MLENNENKVNENENIYKDYYNLDKKELKKTKRKLFCINWKNKFGKNIFIKCFI